MDRCLRSLALVLLIASAGNAPAITLAERGRPPACTIVIPRAASPSQRHAAAELQHFTEEMTGVELPIATEAAELPARAILLGDTKHGAGLLGEESGIAALGDDGFRLVTRGGHVLVLGGPVRGTLYGVYELLEQYGGCRWYSSWHSAIPRLERWELPELDERQTPAFAMREPFWFDMFDGDLAARNKVNGNAMRLTTKHGGKVRFGDGCFVHTFNLLCPPDEFFAERPEFFSEINGKRIKDRTQLCLTNPEVVKIVTGRLLERIRRDPGAKLFSVSQNDWHNPCTCASCKELDKREGSHAGTMITFVNQVAEAVEKEFPEVWIETLAYQYTRKPPATVRPRRNVVPRLCTIECDFSQPLATSRFAQNRIFVDEIRAWSRMTDKLYVWDYTTNFRTYTGPFPNVLALQENVRLFRDSGVVGLFEQGAYQGRHADFAELKAWLLAKWLWNPDLPAERLMDDFFSGYYGAAAPLVREYFDRLHAFHQPADVWLRIFDDVRQGPVSDAFLAEASALWQRAAELVENDPVRHYNVRMGMIPVLHMRVERLADPGEIKVWLTSDPKRFDLPKEDRRLVAELLGLLEEAGKVRISEHGPRNDEIVTRWRSMLNSAVPAGTADRERVTVEDTVLALGRPGTWGDTVKDPGAGDGSAMKLFNTHYEWCTTLPFRQVAFDPGVRHRIRLRVRVEKDPGAQGEALWTGIYDQENKKNHAFVSRPVSDMGDDYEWIELADWIPTRDHLFWIGPGRFDLQSGAKSAIKGLFIDKIELIRLDR